MLVWTKKGPALLFVKGGKCACLALHFNQQSLSLSLTLHRESTLWVCRCLQHQADARNERDLKLGNPPPFAGCLPQLPYKHLVLRAGSSTVRREEPGAASGEAAKVAALGRSSVMRPRRCLVSAWKTLQNIDVAVLSFKERSTVQLHSDSSNRSHKSAPT